MMSHLLSIDRIAFTISVLSTRLSPITVHSGMFSLFSSLRFCVSVFILTVFHVDLYFVQGKEYRSISILLHVELQFNKHYLLKVLWGFFIVVVLFCLFLCLQLFVFICFWIPYQSPGLHMSQELYLCLHLYSIDQPICMPIECSYFIVTEFFVSPEFLSWELEIVLLRSTLSLSNLGSNFIEFVDYFWQDD